MCVGLGDRGGVPGSSFRFISYISSAFWKKLIYCFLDPPTSEVGPIDSQPFVRPFVRPLVRSFSRKPFIGFL